MNFKVLVSSIALILAGLLEYSTSQVFELDEFNFDQYTKDKDVMLVEYFAPWCHHCQDLQPEWEKAGQALAANREFILGKVDCFGRGESLCKKNHVEMYPLIKLYRHGQFSADYNGGRTAAAIIDFMQKAQSQPSPQGPSEASQPPPPPDASASASDQWAKGAAFQNTFQGNPQQFPTIPSNDAPLPPPPRPPPPPPRLPPPPPPVRLPPPPPVLAAPVAPPVTPPPVFNGEWNPAGAQGILASPPSQELFNPLNNGQGRPLGNPNFPPNLQDSNLWNPFLTDYLLITSPAARYMSHRDPLLPQLHNHFFQTKHNQDPLANQNFGSSPIRESMSASQIEYSGTVNKPFGMQSASSGSTGEPSKTILTLPYQLPGSLGAKLESQNGYKTTSYQMNNGRLDLEPFKSFPEFKTRLENPGLKAFPGIRIKPVDDSIKEFPQIKRPVVTFKPFEFRPLARFGNGNFRSSLKLKEPIHPPLQRELNSNLMTRYPNTFRPVFQPRAPALDFSSARTIDHYPVPGSSRQILHFDLGYRPSPEEKVAMHRTSFRKHVTFNPNRDLRAHQLMNQNLRPGVLESTSVKASRYDSQPKHQDKNIAFNRSATVRNHPIDGRLLQHKALPKGNLVRKPVSPNPLIKFYQKPIPLRNLGNSYATVRASSMAPIVNLPQTDRALIRTKVSKPLQRSNNLRYLSRFRVPISRLPNARFVHPAPPITNGPMRTVVGAKKATPSQPLAIGKGAVVGSTRNQLALNHRLPTWYHPRLPGIVSRLPNARTFEKPKPIPHYGDVWKQIYDFYNKKYVAFQKKEFAKRFINHQPPFDRAPAKYAAPELRTKIKTKGPRLLKNILTAPIVNPKLSSPVHDNDAPGDSPSPGGSHIVSPIWDKRQVIPHKPNVKKSKILDNRSNTWGLLRKRKRNIRKRSRTKRQFPFKWRKINSVYSRPLLRTKRLFHKAKHTRKNEANEFWF